MQPGIAIVALSLVTGSITPALAAEGQTDLGTPCADEVGEAFPARYSS